MRVIRFLLSTAALAALPAMAGAQTYVTPADREALGITIYQGFAMARDARRVPAGAGEIVWTSVPRTIDPGTVVLRAGDRTVDVTSTVVEQDGGRFGMYPEGRRVVLVSPEGARVEAVVASPIGPVFRAGDRLITEWKGHVEIPDPTGAFDPSPSIRWELASAAGGVLTAAYLLAGLSWTGDYVAVLSGEDRLALEGNVTIQNHSGLGYPDARVQLVAGVVRRAGGPEPLMARGMAQEELAMARPAPGADIGREALGEFHLYTVDEPVTLARDATTQLNLFRAPRVPVVQELVLQAEGWRFQGQQGEIPPEHPTIRLRFQNDRASGLGEPLPGGVIHVYRTDPRGDLQFVGDGSIPHTPAGEDVRIVIGQSFDVTARRIQTDWRRIDERTEESAWRVELRNGGERAREVQVIDSFAGEWTILEESLPHEKLDARTARWTVSVPAEGTTNLTYRVRVTY